MATMWVLIWLQAIPGTELAFFQLGSYNSNQKCTVALAKAKVMVTTPSIQVACVQIGISRDD